MTDTVKKRLSFLINLAYFGVLLAILYLVLRKFAGILMPFIIATLIALILKKPVDFFEKKTHQRGVTSVIGVLLFVAVAGGLLTLAGWGIASKIKDFYNFLTGEIQNLGSYANIVRDWVLGIAAKLPESASESAVLSINSFFDDLIENGFANFSFSSLSIDWGSLLSKGGIAVKDTVGQIPSIIVSVIITIVSAIFLTIDLNNILDFAKKQFKNEERRKKIRQGIDLTKTTFSKMVKAYSKIMAITFGEMVVGLGILWLLNIYRSPFLFVIAALTAVVDIIPVLGTGTVLIPWAIISAFGGRYSLTVGLAVMYIVIFVIRQYLEPKLVSGETGLPAIITIASMFIGTKVLGVLGFFILPLIVIVIKKLNEAGILNWFTVEEKEKPESLPDKIRRLLAVQLGKLKAKIKKKSV